MFFEVSGTVERVFFFSVGFFNSLGVTFALSHVVLAITGEKKITFKVLYIPVFLINIVPWRINKFVSTTKAGSEEKTTQTLRLYPYVWCSLGSKTTHNIEFGLC